MYGEYGGWGNTPKDLALLLLLFPNSGRFLELLPLIRRVANISFQKQLTAYLAEAHRTRFLADAQLDFLRKKGLF